MKSTAHKQKTITIGVTFVLLALNTPNEHNTLPDTTYVKPVTEPTLALRPAAHEGHGTRFLRL